MLHRRLPLLQANVLKRSGLIPNAQRFNQTTTRVSVVKKDVETSSDGQNSIQAGQDSPPHHSLSTSELIRRMEGRNVKKRLLLPQKINEMEDVAVGEGEHSDEEPGLHYQVERKMARTDAYLVLRVHDRSALASISPQAIEYVAIRAARSRLSAVLDALATDILDNVFAWNDLERCNMISRFIEISMFTEPGLRNARILALYNMWTSLGSLTPIPRKVLHRIVLAALDENADAEHHIVTSLGGLLLDILRMRSPSAGHQLPDEASLLYRIAQRLSLSGHNQEALTVFQGLIETNQVPSQALPTNAEWATEDFRRIVLTTSMKAFYYRGMFWSAFTYLSDLLRLYGKPDAELQQFVFDLVETTLSDATEERLGLVLKFLEHCPYHALVPDSSILRFYEGAYESNLPRLAARLFSHASKGSVRAERIYPTPAGRTLLWLFRHLARSEHDVRLPWVLTMQVAERDVLIPFSDRAEFIALTAEEGLASQARVLWHRYSAGEDSEIVVGNANTMLRMVSAFSSAIEREQGRQSKFSTWARRGSGTFSSNAQAKAEEIRERVTDMQNFAQAVVARFRENLGTLEEADHMHLNALARAYFMLGKVSDGFEVFKVIFNRREIPDMHDINVALSALAKRSPRTAAGMIRRMFARGLQPDKVTFGTVLHHAVLTGDTPLIAWLIGTARKISVEGLSSKAIVSVLRGSISSQLGNKAMLKVNLERALEIIEILKRDAYVPTPRLGTFCMEAALKAEEPVLAFRFWRLLVKRKTKWLDWGHVSHRTRIVHQIRTHMKRGLIRPPEMQKMLEELQHKRTVQVRESGRVEGLTARDWRAIDKLKRSIAKKRRHKREQIDLQMDV